MRWRCQHFKRQRLIKGFLVPFILYQIQCPNNIPDLPVLLSTICLKVRDLKVQRRQTPRADIVSPGPGGQ